MKKMTMGMLIASGICMIGGTSLMVAGIASGGSVGLQVTKNGIRTADDIEEMEEVIEDLQNAKKLILNVEGMRVDVSEGDEFAVTWRYREDEYEIEKTQKGDTTSITVRQKKQPETYVSMFGMGSYPEDSGIYVTIPKDQKLDSLEIVNDYETVVIAGVHTSALKVISESGSVTCEKVWADEAVFQNSGGQIYGERLQGKTLATTTEAADVSFDDAEFGTWTAKTEGGQITGNKITVQKADVQAEDGSIDLEKLDADDVRAVSGTGDIYVNLYDDLQEYHLKLFTKYGEIYVDDADVMEEDGMDGEYERNPDAEKSIELRSREGAINLVQ